MDKKTSILINKIETSFLKKKEFDAVEIITFLHKIKIKTVEIFYWQVTDN